MPFTQERIAQIVGKMCRYDSLEGYILGCFDVRIVKKIHNPLNIQTAMISYTGGTFQIEFVEAFMDTLQEKEVMAVLKHEVDHWIRGHPWRQGVRNWIKWNVSSDMVCNRSIPNMPKGAIECPPKWKDFTTEEIYELLPDSPVTKIFDYMQEGMGRDSTPEEIEGAQQRVLEEIKKAVGEEQFKKMVDDFSKDRGYEPGSNDDLISRVQAVPFNWKTILRRFFSTKSEETRRTLKRPDRRMAYPWGIKKEEMQNIILGMDVSGSIDQMELTEYFSQVHKLSDLLEDILIITCDAKVQEIFPFDPSKKSHNFKGRGGTDYDPLIKVVNDRYTHYDAMVYLTDGRCSPPSLKPRIPILWVVTAVRDLDVHPKIYAPQLSKED
jgi:predicted metal-dependent peptidase